jgi:hypothetical protein
VSPGRVCAALLPKIPFENHGVPVCVSKCS